MQEQKKEKGKKGFVKKGLILALVGAMVFAMAACGGKDDKKSTAKSTAGSSSSSEKKDSDKKGAESEKKDSDNKRKSIREYEIRKDGFRKEFKIIRTGIKTGDTGCASFGRRTLLFCQSECKVSKWNGF